MSLFVAAHDRLNREWTKEEERDMESRSRGKEQCDRYERLRAFRDGFFFSPRNRELVTEALSRARNNEKVSTRVSSRFKD